MIWHVRAYEALDAFGTDLRKLRYCRYFSGKQIRVHGFEDI